MRALPWRLPEPLPSRPERVQGVGVEIVRPDLDDLAVVQALFDQILVSPNLLKLQLGDAGIYCGKDAVEGDVSSVHKTGRGATVYETQGSLASDHLPVYADFALK